MEYNINEHEKERVYMAVCKGVYCYVLISQRAKCLWSQLPNSTAWPINGISFSRWNINTRKDKQTNIWFDTLCVQKFFLLWCFSNKRRRTKMVDIWQTIFLVKCSNKNHLSQGRPRIIYVDGESRIQCIIIANRQLSPDYLPRVPFHN